MPNAIAPQQPTRLPVRRPTVALALGGGGARGLAHILMLEALEEFGLKPVAIAGTSIGAIYGAAYAAGLPAKLLRAHTEETLGARFDFVRQLLSARAAPMQRVLNLIPLPSALLDPVAVLDIVLPSRVPGHFSELATPLQIVATDFYAQEAMVLSSGPLKRAIAASMALPAVFQPVIVEGRPLVDGGLVNPLPFDLVAGKADITIAIDVAGAASEPEPGGHPSAYEVMVAASQILQRTIVHEKLRASRPDIYINVGGARFHVLEFYRVREILKAAEPAKQQLKHQLSKLLGAETLPALEAPADVPQPLPAERGRKRGISAMLPRRRRPRQPKGAE